MDIFVLIEWMSLWNDHEVEVLVVLSFSLQVVLLILSEMCRCRAVLSRRKTYITLRTILWVAYMLSDTTSIYTLGHMSFSCKKRSLVDKQLMAFWAPFLLVHLGGQDTITAYSMEDNKLWQRHLIADLLVQFLAASYVIFRYCMSNWAVFLAAYFMLLVGLLKFGQRLNSQRLSSQGNILNFLEGVEIKEKAGPYTLQPVGHEEVLQGAHDLIYICLGQFVDYKVWPSEFQSEAIQLYDEWESMFELAVMQLSLMRDILFTKAHVIYMRRGCCIRVVSVLFTVCAVILFSLSSPGKWDSSYSKEDIVVTYAMVYGAILMEVISLLRLALSTWTCALLRTGKWNGLHKAIISLRNFVGAAKSYRGWSGSIGQHNLTGLIQELGATSSCIKLKLWWRGLDCCTPVKISKSMESLVLKEIKEMVIACQGNQETLWGYRGQRVLGQWPAYNEDADCRVEDIGFDGSILVLHVATHIFLKSYHGPFLESEEICRDTVRVLSNYMVFLLAEVPHLLPSPIRRTQCDDIRKNMQIQSEIRDGVNQNHPKLSSRGKLAWKMKRLVEDEQSDIHGVVKLMLRVWVEMLCYAAGHCNSYSHASQLSTGIEFLTIIWILTNAEYNRAYSNDPLFKEKATAFFRKHTGIFVVNPSSTAVNDVTPPTAVNHV